MQPLNAIDAVAPAFTRTHQILFHPFRLGRSWKLAFCQYLGFLGAVFIPFPFLMALVPIGEFGVARAAFFLLATIMSLVLFVFFYLGARMQFVNFEMIVTQAQFIAPMWRRYGSRVWPVIALKTILGTVLPLAMLPFLWKAGRALFQTFIGFAGMPRITGGQPPDPQMIQAMFAPLFAQMIGLYATLFCAFIVIKLVSSAFEDFVMPFYILEDITLTASMRRGFAVLAADPLQCILYLILKLVLSIIGFIMQYISTLVALIPVFLVGLIAAGVGFGANALLHGLGSVGYLLLFAVAALFQIAIIAVLLWYQTGTLGYLATLLEAYAIFFLGGRYPLLGNMLEPGPGIPFTPPPVFPLRTGNQRR